MNKDKQADADFALALSLQEQFENEAAVTVTKDTTSEATSYPKSIVDASWEVIDPVPNIHQLFVDFDAMFFKSACAGVCSYEGRGGLCSVRLSSPLLKLRPRRDLVQTLLHEMIHAYLFVTANNKDHDAHGPNFLEHMYRINKLTGANITVYHSFHSEVDEYRQHWWRCTGACRSRPPYYGFVKRAMNRAPSPKDQWWAKHKAECGGKYEKVREPEGYKKKKASSTDGEPSSSNSGVKITADGKIVAGGKRGRNIKDFFSDGSKIGKVDAGDGSDRSKGLLTKQGNSHGRILGSSGGTEGRPPSPDSLRGKLAAAAEKRLKESSGGARGGRKDPPPTGSKGCPGRSRIGRGTSGSGNPPPPPPAREHTNTGSSKKGKPSQPASSSSSSSIADDCVVLDAEVQEASRTPACSDWDTVIDLEDFPMSSYHMDSTRGSDIATGSRDIGARSRDVATRSRDVVIDLGGSPPTTSNHAPTAGSRVLGRAPELKMCPVCGRNDIPSQVINTHVSLCLEEESLDTLLED